MFKHAQYCMLYVDWSVVQSPDHSIRFIYIKRQVLCEVILLKINTLFTWDQFRKVKQSCKTEKLWHDSLVRLSSETFCCRQKSCLCHSISSILIIFTSAQSASGSEGEGKIWEKNSSNLFGTWSMRWDLFCHAHLPLTPRALSKNHILSCLTALMCTYVQQKEQMLVNIW